MMTKKFQLTIIGSGTMMPTKARHPSCYLLEIDNRKILLDIGHTSVARLVDQNIDLHSIDTLFISHFHADHFADILPLIHSRWVDDMHHHEKKHRPLTVIGPKSLRERWEKLNSIFWVEPEESYPIKFVEGVQTINEDALRIELFEVIHVPWYQSLGIKITVNNKSLVYTGDIGGKHPIAQLKQVVQDVNVLLIEAGYPQPTPNHFTIDQIIEITDDCGVKKTIATHIRDKNLPILKEKIKNHKNIILAEDLMKIKI